MEWRELDSAFLECAACDPARIAGALRRRAEDGELRRWVAEIHCGHCAVRTRRCGRHYSFALLALADALAAEPSSSPLATSASLDDLRADAFLVAGETAGAAPSWPLVDQVLTRADRRLSELRVPLRATGYLLARDDLRRVIDPLLAAAGRRRA